MRNTDKNKNIILSLAPAILVIGVLFGASILYGLAQSLGLFLVNERDVISFDAYLNVLSGKGASGREFWISMAFSLWIAVSSTLVSAIFATPLAIWLNKQKGFWRKVDILFLNWNLSFPHLVWAIGMLMFFSQSGLIARFAASFGWIESPSQFPILVKDRLGIGIIIDYITKEIPFLTLTILAVLRSQTENYEIVAQNLGATRWQRLWFITIPQVLPALASGSLLVFAFVFGAYEVPAILGVRYPRMLPVLALDLFTNPDLNSRAEGMVISFIIALVVLVVAVVNLKIERKWKQDK